MDLQQLQFLMMPPPVDPVTGQPLDQGGPPGAAPPQGGAMAASNSNQNSGSTKSVPSGNKTSNQKQGPA